MRVFRTVCALVLALIVGACVAIGSEGGSGKTEEPRKSAFDASLYSGGDGLSKESAIVLNSRSPFVGVPSEYEWIRHHYPGAKRLTQALTPWEDDKRYDILTVEKANGERITLWFEISSLYR